MSSDLARKTLDGQAYSLFDLLVYLSYPWVWQIDYQHENVRFLGAWLIPKSINIIRWYSVSNAQDNWRSLNKINTDIHALLYSEKHCYSFSSHQYSIESFKGSRALTQPHQLVLFLIRKMGKQLLVCGVNLREEASKNISSEYSGAGPSHEKRRILSHPKCSEDLLTIYAL